MNYLNVIRRYRADLFQLLRQMWNSIFENRSAAAKILIYCHSQGAIHVRNALLDYPPELRSRIVVIAIAPAAYIYQKSCAHVVHLRNESPLRDFVPRLDSLGAKREQDSIFDIKSRQFSIRTLCRWPFFCDLREKTGSKVALGLPSSPIFSRISSKTWPSTESPYAKLALNHIMMLILLIML